MDVPQVQVSSRPIVTKLPRLMVFTDRHASVRPLQRTVASAVHAGARLVILTELDLPRTDRERIADDLWPLLASVGGYLIMAGSSKQAGGNHLGARERRVRRRRNQILGRDCHDEQSVTRAGLEGCDYATVSPIFAPPPVPQLGLGRLSRCVAADHAPPIFAFGGISSEAVAACLATGAHGIAVRQAVMAAAEPGPVVAGLLRSIERATNVATAV